jgi:hypothetical protein
MNVTTNTTYRPAATDTQLRAQSERAGRGTKAREKKKRVCVTHPSVELFVFVREPELA